MLYSQLVALAAIFSGLTVAAPGRGKVQAEHENAKEVKIDHGRAREMHVPNHAAARHDHERVKEAKLDHDRVDKVRASGREEARHDHGRSKKIKADHGHAGKIEARREHDSAKEAKEHHDREEEVKMEHDRTKKGEKDHDQAKDGKADRLYADKVEARSHPTHYGLATFYYQNGDQGSCGDYHSDNDYIVAISDDYPFTYNSHCGQYVTITNNGGGDENYGYGKTIQALVADTCPECKPDHLDLSAGAFEALTGGRLDPPGQFNIEWHLN